MASVLGKRKSRNTELSISEEEAQAIFRRHFEAQFKPLPEQPKSNPQIADDDLATDTDESDDSEWGGISDEDDGDGSSEQSVEVIDHTSSNTHDPTVSMSKRELKAFMSSRPPSTDTTPSSVPAPAEPPSDPEDEDERTLRAQDLALQRLLSESHLLASLTPGSVHSTAAAHKPFAAGRLRHKTTDLRIQSLAGADSIYDQKKMPMAMRKRILATRQARDDKRRREAKENGIILEHPSSINKNKKTLAPARPRRDQAVDAPAVGRLKGAQLRLSERDVRAIEGSGGRDSVGRVGPGRAGAGKRGRR
ncbi:hypothetical protein SODALDRAFT_351412 [Sodiomyces alkalinus F11]|uniref:Uncharacterized protein n=1 Tax=Sodiomyces alkalinus (strain CBS 110278 / VKM F-3762 / F11) TaxID=1314773 RepID=A0A3N2PV23_SODAK|nr:hypothetical protein SODALDRAFT_351412 [Sodiomyces alkalinus F11]ROT38339.1 hypothetical protein SODALDRAFT_351412 [Sodiomyces alkalinus F11]